MKILPVMFVLIAATAASAQSLQDCYNNIGIFTSPVLDLQNVTVSDVNYDGPDSVQVTAYVVLINPYNENTGEPIRTVGGFEFRIEFPDDAFVTPVPAMQTHCGCFQPVGDFYCGAALPVTDNQCVLASLIIRVFDRMPRDIYLAPVSSAAAQSFPGNIAIADADDGFSISLAAPASGDFANPVFSMFNSEAGAVPVRSDWTDCWAVPTQPTGWGDIKAMYR